MSEHDDRYSVDGVRAVPSASDVVGPSPRETRAGGREHLFDDLLILPLRLEPGVVVYARSRPAGVPVEELHSVPRSQRVVEVVARSSDEAVKRHGQADNQLRHQVRVATCWARCSRICVQPARSCSSLIAISTDSVSFVLPSWSSNVVVITRPSPRSCTIRSGFFTSRYVPLKAKPSSL